MVLFVFCFSILGALVIAGDIKSTPAESSQYMINVDWLDSSDKLSLIARWGVK